MIAVSFFTAKSVSAQHVEHTTWTVDISCSDGLWVFCPEEPVYGYVEYNVVTQYDKSENFAGQHFNPRKYTKLYGSETGMVYKVYDAGIERVIDNDNNDQHVYMYVNHLMFTGAKGFKY